MKVTIRVDSIFFLEKLTVLLIAIVCMLSVETCFASFPKINLQTKLFHNGGTGECEGCHLTRGGKNENSATWNSSDSEVINANLRGSDPGSTCLRCHEAPAAGSSMEHYVSTRTSAAPDGIPPEQLTPGGDFAWLKKSYGWRPEDGNMGARENSPGEHHGHNIVAADFGYYRDGSRVTAPGGSFPSARLSCISCHDPHGNYRRNADGSVTSSGLPVGSSGTYADSPEPDSNHSVSVYRMLAGRDYQPDGENIFRFQNDPPAAVAPKSYNRSESVSDTRVAYGKGMSEWCRNCHSDIHGSSNGRGSQHPVGDDARLTYEIVGNYNSYIASGNLNGYSGKSYSSLVPFEMGSDDYEALRKVANSDGSDLTGPGGGSGTPNVMCLTCHRAHASGWDSMTRWNVNADFLVVNSRYPGIDNGASSWTAQGRTAAETQKAYYDRPASRFASYQRSLCNKCHAKD